MRILKFGGSSFCAPEDIGRVKRIVEGQQEQVIVVVSAMSGMTDQMKDLCRQAASRSRSYVKTLDLIEARHANLVKSIFEPATSAEVMQGLNPYFGELKDIIQGIYLLNDLTPKIRDRVLSLAELVMAYIISRALAKAEMADARKFIRTDDSFGHARVDFDSSERRIRRYFNDFKGTAVVPGSVASGPHGETTTLGRGGSDYTAAILSAALEVERLEIWTHVDGFMTADPEKVKQACAIDSLSYAEAMELSHFGAEVIYTPTIHPVYRKNIEIHIKNIYNPDARGTIIAKESVSPGRSLIKGISSIDQIALVTMQGAGLVGRRGTSSRLFSSLAQHDVNIILITQASSEYSITFAIHPGDLEKATKALEQEFEDDIHIRKEIHILVEHNLSVIAIVGEKMRNTPGISAILFNALGRNGINVVATAQGSSELNISIVIKKDSLNKALNVIHEGFFLFHHKELNLFLVGLGTVGGKLLEQIRDQQKVLLREHHLKINLIGICDIERMLISHDTVSLRHYREELNARGDKTDMKVFIERMQRLNLRNSVYVDCTADPGIAGTYKQVMDSYISVVTPNKIACSSSYALYRELKTTAHQRNVKFYFETNVGAGLPIISTLNDLIRSGDKIIRLEAVLSGTLNFIFNTISEKVRLSQAVRLAMEQGFAEPDPRIDLSGIDVKRKLLILSRESGYAFEPEDIKVIPFLPAECFEGTLDDFWESIKKYDDAFEERRKKLTVEKKRLRYVARLADGVPSVELVEVDFSHPAFPLEGSNNIILITTDRYREQPMVIRGYGAGAAVTAAGIFADIIRIANL